jgi:hypothetical protein
MKRIETPVGWKVENNIMIIMNGKRGKSQKEGRKDDT